MTFRDHFSFYYKAGAEYLKWRAKETEKQGTGWERQYGFHSDWTDNEWGQYWNSDKGQLEIKGEIYGENLITKDMP